MMNRREFVTIGATTLAASTVLGGAVVGNASIGPDATAGFTLPFRVIFDRRAEDARLFAEQAVRLGAALVGIGNDVAELWYDELRPRLQQGPAALAGLTTPSALFCLQQLASNHWMKVRFRAEHRLAAAGLLEHRLQGPEHLLLRARDSLSVDAEWRTQMANLVTQCPAGATTTNRCTLLTRGDGAERRELSLVSWIIAA